MKKHSFLLRFSRMLKENNLSQFEIDWNIVIFLFNAGFSPENVILELKERKFNEKT